MPLIEWSGLLLHSPDRVESEVPPILGVKRVFLAGRSSAGDFKINRSADGMTVTDRIEKFRAHSERSTTKTASYSSP